MYQLTIFTPTYNRAYCLNRLYSSLLEQSNKDFIWIIVDDGSKDETKKIVENWIKENKIKIKYYWQNNQGKMQAHNYGVKECKTDLFTCVDSDDWLEKDSVDKIIKKYDEIKNKKDITGIVTYKIYSNKKIIGGRQFPQKTNETTLMNLYNKYKFRGDTMLIYKTNFLKRYLFPKIKNENFIQEDYIYDQIDKEGKLYILREKLYICEYLEDGYSKNIKKIIADNPKGYTLAAKQRIKLSESLKVKFIACAKFVLGNKLQNNKKYLNEVDGLQNKILIIFAKPFAEIEYLKKYKKYGEK